MFIVEIISGIGGYRDIVLLLTVLVLNLLRLKRVHCTGGLLARVAAYNFILIKNSFSSLFTLHFGLSSSTELRDSRLI